MLEGLFKAAGLDKVITEQADAATAQFGGFRDDLMHVLTRIAEACEAIADHTAPAESGMTENSYVGRSIPGPGDLPGAAALPGPAADGAGGAGAGAVPGPVGGPGDVRGDGGGAQDGRGPGGDPVAPDGQAAVV